MKKSIYLIAGILIAGTLFFVFSCSKEGIKNENQNQPAQTVFDKQIIKAIKEFKQKVAYYKENTGYKSGEAVSADSALFLLEGTINYCYSFMNDYYVKEQIDSLMLTVPKNGSGEVDMDVLIEKYEEMKSEITSVYQNSNFENKRLAAVDLSENSQNEDAITFNVDVITGDKGTQPPTPVISGPFGPGDNWWYGEYAGKCYDTVSFSDAAHQIGPAISNYIFHYNQDHGYVFFAPLVFWKFKGGDPHLRRHGDVMNNHADYYMYNAWEYIGISDDTLCIEWPEMNLYYQYLRYWLYTKMVDSLQALNIWQYQPAQITDMQGNHDEIQQQYYHIGYFLFGHPVITLEGEGPEEL